MEDEKDFMDGIAHLEDDDLLELLFNLLQSERTPDIDDKVKHVVYQVRTRLFIARILFGQMVAISKEAGELSPLDTEGFISHKQHLEKIKGAVDNSLELVHLLMSYEMDLEDAKDMQNIKFIDKDGNIYEKGDPNEEHEPTD